jgi:hypothetical protein
LVSLNLILLSWLHDSSRDWRVLEAVEGFVSEDSIATSSANVQKVVKGWTWTSAVYRKYRNGPRMLP